MQRQEGICPSMQSIQGLTITKTPDITGSKRVSGRSKQLKVVTGSKQA